MVKMEENTINLVVGVLIITQMEVKVRIMGNIMLTFTSTTMVNIVYQELIKETPTILNILMENISLKNFMILENIIKVVTFLLMEIHCLKILDYLNLSRNRESNQNE